MSPEEQKRLREEWTRQGVEGGREGERESETPSISSSAIIADGFQLEMKKNCPNQTLDRDTKTITYILQSSPHYTHTHTIPHTHTTRYIFNKHTTQQEWQNAL